MTRFHERQPDGTWIEKDEPLVTKTGRVLTDEDIERLADEAEEGYSMDAMDWSPSPYDHPFEPSRNTEDEVGCDYCGAPREAHPSQEEE